MQTSLLPPSRFPLPSSSVACAAGKTLSNAGLADAVQTAAACTTPAAASGAFRSVANAAATAVAASFAAAALI